MSPVPVTVVTGYLGAGKTTLVNRILAAATDRIAVIVNEFGEIGIDGELIDSGAEDLVELAGGCVCCVVRGDLIRTLRQLLRQRPDLDRVLIETSGLADPGPVAQSLAADPILAARCRLDAVVAVADAGRIAAQMAADHLAADQIALADVIVLNKAETAADLPALTDLLAGTNPLAEVITATRCDVAVARLTGHDPDPGRVPGAPHHHHGAGGIAAVALTTSAEIDEPGIEAWLTGLLALRGQDILRTKGVFAVPGKDCRLVVQAVHMSLEAAWGRPWASMADRGGRIVFIGRDLDAAELEQGLRAAEAEERKCRSS